ncbi:phage head closure protein [Serratia symbiotica]|uniref:phage head closure protein n=1 Tax=Serratia symbiotica TaxID=138074 RepID=UPI001D67D060|nr:phage head closure protein [Serratia symbiotica]MCX2957536.1 phage head closure protein [Serratia symbiotica]NIG87328.1 phage head closure protein [Serratia symbiotica]USS96667.1 phage head closure protein [Serratia symbiotica]
MKYQYHKPYSRFPDPGELNKRILFYTQHDEPIGDSGVQVTNQGECTVWGKLIPVSDTLRINSFQTKEGITHKIIVRYRKSLYDSNQAVINSIVYSIRGVIDINSTGRFLSFSCEEMRSQPERGNDFG